MSHSLFCFHRLLPRPNSESFFSLRFITVWLLLSFGASVVSASSADSPLWNQFRGPWGDGRAQASGDSQPLGLPLNWSESENIVWKIPTPHLGWSCPVMTEGRIWLTMATEKGTDYYVMSVDAQTGQTDGPQPLFHSDHPEPLGNNVNCYAAPTAVTEGDRVYVHFGSYGTACLDAASGKAIWKRNDMPCRHFRGPGSSPILYRNLLILTFDGVDRQYVTALEKTTGETVWTTDRTTQWTDLDANGQPQREGDFRKSYSTPIILTHDRADQLIAPGSSVVFAYEPLTGREIWKAHHVGYTTAIRPLFADGRLHLATGHGQSEIWTFAVDGQGEVGESKVLWKCDSRDVPRLPSPLLVDGLFYMVSDNGAVNCLDAVTGETLWRDRIGGSHVASPIYGDGRLYFFNTQGKTIVLEAGRAFKKLAENELDEGFMASPAVDGKALILRSKTHLYRIETKR